MLRFIQPKINELFLCFNRVNDVIVEVNQNNVQNVLHSDAVQALKESGNSARLVSIQVTHCTASCLKKPSQY